MRLRLHYGGITYELIVGECIDVYDSTCSGGKRNGVVSSGAVLFMTSWNTGLSEVTSKAISRMHELSTCGPKGDISMREARSAVEEDLW